MARFISPITDMKPNGSLRFFKSGTNTTLVTFKDELESIQNPTIVPVLPNGNVQNVFYQGSAKVLFLDEFDQQYAERDPVGDEVGIGNFTNWVATVVYDENDITKGSDGRFYLSLSNGNQGNDPTLTPTSWEEIRFIGVWNTNITYAIGDVVQTTNGNLWASITATAGNDPSTDDGTNWSSAIDEQWVNKSAAFTVFAGRSYQIDASSGAVDAALKTAYVVGDVIIVHNESISTSTVQLTNASLTINGTTGVISPGTPLELEPGNSVQMVAKTTTTLEVVGAQL